MVHYKIKLATATCIFGPETSHVFVETARTVRAHATGQHDTSCPAQNCLLTSHHVLRKGGRKGCRLIRGDRGSLCLVLTSLQGTETHWHDTTLQHCAHNAACQTVGDELHVNLPCCQFIHFQTCLALPWWRRLLVPAVTVMCMID